MDQTLELLIVNESTNTKDFQVALLDGMTTKDGTINYSTDHTYDDSQRYKISEIGKLEQNVLSVPPNSSVIVKIELKHNISNFFGTILGAVNVSEKEDTNTRVGVNNSFAYSIPIKARVVEEHRENKLNYKGVKVIAEKTKQDLALTFQNPEPTILRNLNIAFSVYKKETPTTIIWSDEMKGVELAPNSLFYPELSLTEAKLKSGKYMLKIVAKSDEIDHSWESKFTLSSTEGNVLNEGLEVLAQGNQWWLIALGIIIVLVGGVSYVLYKKKH